VTWIIREAGPEDAAAMAELNQWVHTLHVDAEPESYRPLEPTVAAETMATALREGRERVWIAWREDEAVGMVRCEEVHRHGTAHKHPRHYVEVHELVVKPTTRRHGLGLALMETAEKWGSEVGVEVQLTCMGFNEAALRFYDVAHVRYRKR
jgi:ribosomal protein S18 acetylase RimI-like enzyme